MAFAVPTIVATAPTITADRLENDKVTDCHFVRFEPERGRRE
jgi:hypothetical protein